MSRKDEIRKELGQLSPFLRTLKDEAPPFKVPDNYFQSLSEDILSRVDRIEEEAPVNTGKPLDWQERWWAVFGFLFRPQIAVAFGIILLVLVVGITLYKNHNAQPTGTYTSNDISLYVRENLDEFELDMLLDFYREEATVNSSQTENEYLDNIVNEIIEDTDLVELEDLL